MNQESAEIIKKKGRLKWRIIFILFIGLVIGAGAFYIYSQKNILPINIPSIQSPFIQKQEASFDGKDSVEMAQLRQEIEELQQKRELLLQQAAALEKEIEEIRTRIQDWQETL